MLDIYFRKSIGQRIFVLLHVMDLLPKKKKKKKKKKSLKMDMVNYCYNYYYYCFNNEHNKSKFAKVLIFSLRLKSLASNVLYLLGLMDTIQNIWQFFIKSQPNICLSDGMSFAPQLIVK